MDDIPSTENKKEIETPKSYTDEEIKELLKMVGENNSTKAEETPKQKIKRQKMDFRHELLARPKGHDMENALTPTKKVLLNDALPSREIDPITPWVAASSTPTNSDKSFCDIPNDLYYDEDLSLFKSGQSQKIPKASGYGYEKTVSFTEDDRLKTIEKIMSLTDNVTLSLCNGPETSLNNVNVKKDILLPLLEAQTNLILSDLPLITCKFSYWTSPKFEYEWQGITPEVRRLLEFFQSVERPYSFLELYEFYSKFRIEQLPYLVDSIEYLVKNFYIKKR